ncbi:hypothetical protein ACFQLX_17955 [Streptomyces polyrhachis]|uniref:SPOR domain-containing protein n=1 Tax=Streptomyces polyrhachis TaxID=1282885 RepID=A0ABW2GH23_9ACTN
MALFKKKTPDESDEGWYYCIEHRAVEQGPQCPARDRLGPYPTREAAEHAIQIAEARNEKWDSDDDRWRDGDDKS